MAISFDQFFYGIAQQESGGRYNVVNGGTGALGRYQILPSNVGPWSQKYLGQSWTPQQFLADPTKQDALARAVLLSYYNQYGARGAASAWYSGRADLSESTRPQNGGPSIKDYVDQVLARGLGFSSHDTFSSVRIPTTVTDKTANADKPLGSGLRDTSGMGAVSAPGAEMATSAGAQAITAPGAEAVGSQQGMDSQPQDGQGPVIATPANTPGGVGDPTSARQLALAAATRWVGTPYVFGGGGTNGPSKSSLAHGNYQDVGFDCSGLVQYALAMAGVTAPRLSYDQLKLGAKVPVSQLQPGDLVGMEGGGHIAIYLGNGQIIEAPHTGASVRIRTLGSNEGAWGVSLASLYR